MLLEKRLPRREEHRSADVQPDPFAVIPPCRIDDGAVPEVLRRRPACFRRVSGGGGRALAHFVVFVIVVVIVDVAVVSVATVKRRHPSDVRGSPLVVRCSSHLERRQTVKLKGSEDVPLRPTFVRLTKRTRFAHYRNSRQPPMFRSEEWNIR